MGYKELKEKRWFRILGNKYLIIILVFSIWMLFFDSNSWFSHRELNQEMKELENNKTYYEDEIKQDGAVMEQLNDTNGLERYAREKYFMKRENEDVYIIEYKDSVSE